MSNLLLHSAQHLWSQLCWFPVDKILCQVQEWCPGPCKLSVIWVQDTWNMHQMTKLNLLLPKSVVSIFLLFLHCCEKYLLWEYKWWYLFCRLSGGKKVVCCMFRGPLKIKHTIICRRFNFSNFGVVLWFSNEDGCWTASEVCCYCA